MPALGKHDKRAGVRYRLSRRHEHPNLCQQSGLLIVDGLSDLYKFAVRRVLQFEAAYSSLIRSFRVKPILELISTWLSPYLQ
jgi:hypothetical protein